MSSIGNILGAMTKLKPLDRTVFYAYVTFVLGPFFHLVLVGFPFSTEITILPAGKGNATIIMRTGV